MSRVAVGVLLALAAASLGLRTTSVLIPRVHPVLRMLVSVVIGTVFVIVALQLSDQYHVRDLGLGLLVSLSPVGVFDVAKWWYRFRAPWADRTSTPGGEGDDQPPPPQL